LKPPALISLLRWRWLLKVHALVPQCKHVVMCFNQITVHACTLRAVSFVCSQHQSNVPMRHSSHGRGGFRLAAFYDEYGHKVCMMIDSLSRWPLATLLRTRYRH